MQTIREPEGSSAGIRSAAGARRARTSLAVLGVALAAFVVVRAPMLWRQPGGMDEEYYAIPGLTILDGGVPRMPHVPQRDPASAFYRADQAVFAEPPLSFYWQSLLFAILPDVYGAARLASAVAGLVSVWLVYELARALSQSETAAVWGAVIYSLARTFYFPAITARPDLLCTAFGLGALVCLARWQVTRSRTLLFLCGVLLGLGGLTHPLAIVFALQAAAWTALASRGWQRLARPALLAAAALAVFALWLPLIVRYPEAFRAQFGNNIMGAAGPGLLWRMVFPWAALKHHVWMLWEHLRPIQFSLLFAGGLGATLLDFRRAAAGPRAAWLLAWSSVYLVATMAGIHPTQYFWCYPTALLCVCVGRVIARGGAALQGMGRGEVLLKCAAGALLIALMLPGAGLRTWLAHLRHWNDIDYNAPAFARRMLDDLPRGARYTVDREFVLDFVAAGRRTLIAETHPFYLVSKEFPYDYLIISRHGLDEDLPTAMNGELVRTYGRRDDLFACYAEIYRPAQRSGRDD